MSRSPAMGNTERHGHGRGPGSGHGLGDSGEARGLIPGLGAKFVEDNSITNGDSLVFSYDGYGLFDFALFDQFECEKIVVRDAQPQVNKEVKEEEDDDVVVVNDDDDNDNDGGDNGDEGDR
nr:B3 domain-containing protein At5g60140-like [Ipomoea trifida]